MADDWALQEAMADVWVGDEAMTDVWAERLGARYFDARTRRAWSKIFCLITSQVSDGYNEYKSTAATVSVAMPTDAGQ